jgi:hypothetical protein
MDVQSVDNQMDTNKAKPGWDTRVWLIGGAGGFIATAALLVSSLNRLQRLYETATNIFSLVGALCIFAVLPPVLAGLSRRRWLLWPFLPYVFFFVASTICYACFTTAFLSPTDTFEDEFRISLLLGIAPLVFSLPVIVIRILNHRRHRRLLAVSLAEESGAHIDEAWPPRPRET